MKFVSDDRLEEACDPTDDRMTPIPGCWRSRTWESLRIDEIQSGAILINKKKGAAYFHGTVTTPEGGQCTRLHELTIDESGHAFGIGAFPNKHPTTSSIPSCPTMMMTGIVARSRMTS